MRLKFTLWIWEEFSPSNAVEFLIAWSCWKFYDPARLFLSNAILIALSFSSFDNSFYDFLCRGGVYPRAYMCTICYLWLILFPTFLCYNRNDLLFKYFFCEITHNKRKRKESLCRAFTGTVSTNKPINMKINDWRWFAVSLSLLRSY
jgi:hypothetical protein